MNRHFTKDDTQLVSTHVKRYSASLVFQEVQIKPAVRYRHVSVRQGGINKTPRYRVLTKDVAHLAPAGGNAEGHGHLGKSARFYEASIVNT